MNNVAEFVKGEIAEQRGFCLEGFLTKKDYYKKTIRAIVWVAGISALLFGAIIGWSYNPMGDIRELKVEFRVMDAKLDQIIKQNGGHDE